MSASRSAGSQRDNERPSLRQLAGGPIVVWLVLLVLLAGSVWSAFYPLGPFNPAINLMLAAVMLFLLATFLMDLRNASALLRLVAAGGLFWVIFLFALTFTDYLSRRPTMTTHADQSATIATTPRH